jgi:hypothetical protein
MVSAMDVGIVEEGMNFIILIDSVIWPTAILLMRGQIVTVVCLTAWGGVFVFVCLSSNFVV